MNGLNSLMLESFLRIFFIKICNILDNYFKGKNGFTKYLKDIKVVSFLTRISPSNILITMLKDFTKLVRLLFLVAANIITNQTLTICYLRTQ